MEILIAFYSKTGVTREIAMVLAEALGCDIDEIIDKKDRTGMLGYIKAGRDAMKRTLTQIEYERDPKEYDLVVIGTPIWGWNMSPAVRTYLSKNKFKKAAFFCTMGGSGDHKAFREMEELSVKPLATMSFFEKEVKARGYSGKINVFLEKLKIL